MAQVVQNLDELLNEVEFARDETGALRALFAAMPAPGPLLLIVADSAGRLLAAEAFSPAISRDDAHRLAFTACAALDDTTPSVFAFDTARAKLAAFALKIHSGARAGILSAIYPSREPAENASVACELQSTLAACATMALAAVSTAGDLRKSQTENRHLRAEHTTLHAAHTEAILAAVREREERAVLEASQIAMEQFLSTAQKASQSKSEFLASMSHEIRTPMTAILGYSEEIIDQVKEPECLAAAHTIRRNGEYLLEIINDILDISKLEAGKMVVERIECSPASIVNDAVGLMKIRAESKGLLLEVEFDSLLPDRILTDPTRVKQILINLLGNAVKFTGAGTVRLVVSHIDAQTPQPKLRFDVIDTGCGIASRQIAKLFHPFVQGEASTNREHGGTGLGLVISKRLAEMLGGDLTVESAPGHGSTFTATIETGSLDAAVAINYGPIEPTARKRAIAHSRSQISLAGRILLAEDSPDNQRLVATILRRAGAEVLVAENGQIAVEQTLAGMASDGGPTGDFPIDVILMDVDMPVMNGYEATRQLRKAGYTKPIIALTAHAMAHHIEESRLAGCDAHVTKPIDREELLKTIAQALQRERK